MGVQEGARAIVVEDDATVRVYLDRALQRAGLEVVGAATGEQALALVRGADPEFDIALVDGLLPDVHGLELTRWFLDEPRATRMAICLLSGTVRRSVPVRAGISALSKPPRLAELLEHVETMRRWRATGSPPSERRAALALLESGLLVS
jgi:two-component system cell cycle response regulator CpdR